MIRIKISKISVLFLVCILVLSACSSTSSSSTVPKINSLQSAASTQEPVTVITGKLSHSSASGSTYDVGALKFKDLVEEKTKGSVVIEVYPSAQLGGDRDALEGQRMGTVDFSLPGTSMLSQYAPSVAVFNMPFLFGNREEAYKVLDGDVGKEIYAASKEHGIIVLATFESGFRQVATVSKPITQLADLKGQKIRVPDGELYVKAWKALGVNPTVIGWNELFTALQTGVVTGEEAPITSFDSAGFSEIVKHFSYINYMYDPVILGVSQGFWERLNSEQQQAVQEAANEARDFERQYVQEQETIIQKKLEGEGVKFYNPELTDFQKAMKTVYDEYSDQNTLKKVMAVLDR